MVANHNPIFTLAPRVRGSLPFTTAAADYTGQGVNNQTVWKAGANGGYVDVIRFKALGTNVASVMRIYYSNGNTARAAAIAAVAGTPTGTPSASGGTLASGNFFAKIYAVDQNGAVTAASTETAAVAVTGPTGSITWNWTAVTGAVSYIIAVGLATNAQVAIFTSTTNSYVQTDPGDPCTESFDISNNNNTLIAEVSLPATTASATAATVEIEYALRMPIGIERAIVMGLGTTVAAGWVATVWGGHY